MSTELILEEFLPYRLSILSNTVSSSIASTYEKRFGLSIPEWRVIAVLGRFPGISAVEVAQRTMMDKVAVSRAVSKLIKRGRIDFTAQNSQSYGAGDIFVEANEKMGSSVAHLWLGILSLVVGAVIVYLTNFSSNHVNNNQIRF